MVENGSVTGSGNGSGFAREVAHRIFAAEFRESNLQAKEGQDQYSPSYLITPTGAKCNRVFIVGTLTEKEDVGTDAEFWRGRIVDPTGAFFVNAGQYQPEAAQMLAKTTPPEFIAVIGKPLHTPLKKETFLRPSGLRVSRSWMLQPVIDGCLRPQSSPWHALRS
jgi:RPA family protein